MTESERLDKAQKLIWRYGHYDKERHRQWLLDQLAQAILDTKAYEWFTKPYSGWSWDKGISP